MVTLWSLFAKSRIWPGDSSWWNLTMWTTPLSGFDNDYVMFVECCCFNKHWFNNYHNDYIVLLTHSPLQQALLRCYGWLKLWFLDYGAMLHGGTSNWNHHGLGIPSGCLAAVPSHQFQRDVSQALHWNGSPQFQATSWSTIWYHTLLSTSFVYHCLLVFSFFYNTNLLIHCLLISVYYYSLALNDCLVFPILPGTLKWCTWYHCFNSCQLLGPTVMVSNWIPHPTWQ